MVTLTAEPAHDRRLRDTLTMQVDVSRTIASVSDAPITLSSTNNSTDITINSGRERQEPCRRHVHAHRVFGHGGGFHRR